MPSLVPSGLTTLTPCVTPLNGRSAAWVLPLSALHTLHFISAVFQLSDICLCAVCSCSAHCHACALVCEEASAYGFPQTLAWQRRAICQCTQHHALADLTLSWSRAGLKAWWAEPLPIRPCPLSVFFSGGVYNSPLVSILRLSERQSCESACLRHDSGHILVTDL